MFKKNGRASKPLAEQAPPAITNSSAEAAPAKGRWLSKNYLIDKAAISIREKAIKRAKTRIALHGREVSDYSEEQLETIVKEEEDKIISDYKKMSIFGLLALIGIGGF